MVRDVRARAVQAAAIRFLLAGTILGAVALAIGAPFPRGRELTGSLLFGVLQFGIGFACIYYGYAHTPAGLGQVLQACIPLLTFVLAIAHRQERFRWSGLVGSMLAIAGIAVVFGSGVEAGVPLASMFAMLAGAVVWAESLIVVRAFPRAHPAAMGAVAMVTGTVVLLALSAVTGETWAVPVERSTWLAQAYLVLPGGVVVLWSILLVLAAMAGERGLVPAGDDHDRDGGARGLAARGAPHMDVRARRDARARRGVRRGAARAGAPRERRGS